MSWLGRGARTAQNLLEVARFGGLHTDDLPAPFEVVAQDPMYRLRRYATAGESTDRAQLLLVPPLMLTAEIFDVSENASGVRALIDGGLQPWLVDFGSPETEEGGLERTMEQHVLAIDDAVDRVVAATGRPVHLVGYSQGGMFCYQVAAYRRSRDIASVITFGSPVDLHGAAPLGLPASVTTTLVPAASAILGGRAVPGWATRTGFRLVDPIGTIQNRLSFLLALHDRDALLPREGQRKFLMHDGWVAWPGPALEYFLDNFIVHNRLLAGGFSIGGKAVSLADMKNPVLTFLGEVDEFAPPLAVRAIRGAAPRAPVYEVSLAAGHFGLVVGRAAMSGSWPLVPGWTAFVEDGADLPGGIATEPPDDPAGASPTAGLHRVGLGVTSLAAVASNAVQAVASTVATPVRSLSGPRAEFRRLARMDLMTAQSRISLAGVMAEQAAARPTQTAFLYEDRTYDFATISASVDLLVHELIRRGVVAGEHVGVLMESRPTALGVVAALNRIGAVAVLMRPDGLAAVEARVGGVTRVVVDPEHADADTGGITTDTLLLPGGAEASAGVGVDDTDGDHLPAWYHPNPGRARDLAFVLFSGAYDEPRRMDVTNGRWALTAYGTAMSARLDARDTVLTMSPVHHPAGLLVALGGSLAGGCRVSLTRRLDPESFWSQVRRYGVTVVSYTWSELLPLVEAPHDPLEDGHSIRLFLGSGMPKGLWQRVLNRFSPAQVVEFWSSNEGSAILANVRGTKPGSAGRPLPGAAELRLVRFDRASGRILRDDDGWAIEIDNTEEAGMLIAQERHGMPSGTGTLRGVFQRDDTWRVTGTVFRRDADGDHWLLGTLSDAVHTAEGPRFTATMTRVFGELSSVSAAVAYGLATKDGHEVPTVAVQLRPGATLTPRDLTIAADASAPHLAGLVHVVEIPTTDAFRPDARAIATAGPDPASHAAWRWDPAKQRYVPLTAAALRRLTGAPPPRSRP